MVMVVVVVVVVVEVFVPEKIGSLPMKYASFQGRGQPQGRRPIQDHGRHRAPTINALPPLLTPRYAGDRGPTPGALLRLSGPTLMCVCVRSMCVGFRLTLSLGPSADPGGLERQVPCTFTFSCQLYLSRRAPTLSCYSFSAPLKNYLFFSLSFLPHISFIDFFF